MTLRLSSSSPATLSHQGMTQAPQEDPTWPRARLWSRRVRQVMFSAGMEGAFSFRISAFVFAGLATTSTCEACRWC